MYTILYNYLVDNQPFLKIMIDKNPVDADEALPFLFQGNRDEISNAVLTVLQGTIPQDLYGFVYLMTQCGTVNSGGYPFPKTINGEPNPEYGSPVLNGNGMIFRFDLSDPTSIKVSSKLVKTPSYYADEASRIGGPARQNPAFTHFHFNNAGISRMSVLLGAVNYANTAIIPVQFNNDSGPSLLATYDTGRPIKINPDSLDFVTPIGYNSEWMQGMPRFLQAPFPMFETTAHPSWDPLDKTLYGVNFSKSTETEMSRSYLYQLLKMDKSGLESKLLTIARDFKVHKSSEKAIASIEALILSAAESKTKTGGGLFQRIKAAFKKFAKSFLGKKINSITQTIDEVLLVKFDGSGQLKTWKLVDEQGKTLVIYQCMHQTSVTRDHIVLMDSSFKFSFDLLINNPFPGNHELDEFLRLLTSKTILPSTQVWLVKKSDLIVSNDTVVARKVTGIPIDGLTNDPYGGVPMECVHFSADYGEENNQITLYTAHNNATCLAEWIRVYDKNYFTDEPYDAANISNYAVGQLSISSIGKYVINSNTNAFEPSKCKVIRQEGNLPPVNQLDGTPLTDVGPNTWGIGLYAYRDMISPTRVVDSIKQLYFVSFGSQPELLTKYIKELYEVVPNRQLSLEDILAYTECGIPQSIISIDTGQMTITSHYEIPWGSYPMSIQFIPCKIPNASRPLEKDGYIWVTVKVLVDDQGVKNYDSQIWIFSAWDIAQGPICKLGGTDFNFCTSLHITWMEEGSDINSGYMVDIENDFNQSIRDSFLDPVEHRQYQDFFEQYVYPNFTN